MTAIYPYIVVGIVVLAGALLQNHLENRKAAETSANKILESLKPDRNLWEKIAEAVLVPALAGILFIIAWPIVMLWLAWQAISNVRRKPIDPPRPFAVTNEDLIEKLTVGQVEQRERIEDPLSAVPVVPFGHLNAAWLHYLDELGAEHELWSFETRRTTSTGCRQHVTGYVATTNGKIGPEFIVMRTGDTA